MELILIFQFSTASFKSAGYPTSVRKNLVQLGAEEKDHVQFLSSALGASATSPCKYLFDPALETIESFLATARILENVGTLKSKL